VLLTHDEATDGASHHLGNMKQRSYYRHSKVDISAAHFETSPELIIMEPKSKSSLEILQVCPAHAQYEVKVGAAHYKAKDVAAYYQSGKTH
jgi:hypothetical protein